MYRKSQLENSYFKNVNRNIVNPMCNLVHALENNYSSTIEIVEVNSEDDNQNSNDEQNRINECSAENTYDFSGEESSSSNDDKYNHEFIDSIIDYRAIRSIYREFYNDCLDINENILTNHKENHFTTIENQGNASSFSNHDIFENKLYNDKSYKQWNQSSTTLDNQSDYEDFDPEEQNVEFDSFNNAYYITELDRKLQDRSGTKHSDNEDMNQRIPTPAPTYIPRLHFPLNPTLTTITEILEPKTSVTSYEFDIDVPIHKFKNNNLNKNTLCRPQSTNSFNPLPLKEKRNNEKSYQFEAMVNIESLKPNIFCNLQNHNFNQISQAPEVFVCFKSQSNTTECSLVKDSDNIIHKVNNSLIAENIVKMLSLDNLWEYKESQIQLTAKIKSELNSITLFIEKSVDNNKKRNNEFDLNEVIDNDVSTTKTVQEYSDKTHYECISINIKEPLQNSPRHLEDKVSVKNKSIIVSSDRGEKQTWIRKIIKWIHCCK